MTVATQSNSITYQGNGSTTAFGFSFAFPAGLTPSQAAADLQVTFVDVTGVSTIVSFGPGLTQYQLSINPPVSPNPTSVGGVVTYNPGGVPIATGTTLTITRVLSNVQPVSLQNQGTLWQTVIEQALDYLTMVSQGAQQLIGRVIVAPPTDPSGLNYTLPAATARANQALIFDGAGNVGTGVLPATGVISSAMAPVVGAATLPAGRTAFGLKAMATEGIGAGLSDDGAGNAQVLFGINKLSVNTTITVANYLQKIKATGPINLTLPRGNTVQAGFGFWLEVLAVSTGPVTLIPDPADQVEGFGSGVAVTVGPGFNLFLNTDSLTNATWFFELSRGTTTNSVPAGTYSGGLSIDVATTTTATASVGSVSVTDGLQYLTVTPTGGINTATLGAGGVDVLPLTASSWYTAWVIYNPTSRVANWMLSLQTTLAALKPTLPAGFTAAAAMGVLRINASSQLMGTSQRGNSVAYIPGLAGTTPGVPQVASGLQTNQSVALTGVVPPNAKTYKIYLFGPVLGVSAENQASVAPAGFGTVSATTNPPPLAIGSFQSGSLGFAACSVQGEFLGTGPVIYNSTWAGSGVFIQGFDLNL